MSSRTWRLSVGACLLIGLAVRVAAVLARSNLHAAGDAAEYWLLSNYVVEGKGWIEPIIYHGTGLRVQTAKLPPLYTILLMPCSLVGFKSYFAHRIWSGVLNSSVVVIGAALGRRVAGRWAGVLAALGLALYPNIWMPADVGMSETISPVMAMLVVLAAYWAWRHPTWPRTALLGLAVGLAALARDEMIVFAGFVLLPVAYGPRGGGRSWSQRGRLLGAGVAAMAAVLAPWIVFNSLRFSQPMLITDRVGATLASANCTATWNGPYAGYWLQSCAVAAEKGATGDEPARDAVATRVATRYIFDHLAQLPRVELERLGRTFAFWRVGQQVQLDSFVDGRPHTWVEVGLWCFYGLAALAPFGLWRLRRHGVLTFPLWAVFADVILVVLITYGQTRFRATLEPVLVLLAAVAVCWAAGVPMDPIGRAIGGPGLEPGGPGAASSPEPSGPTSEPPPSDGPPAASVL